jgi:hypothetical protein
MKAILFSIFTILFSTSIFAQSGVIAQPEMNILYRGWNNKIIPMIPYNQELILELDGATADTATWTDGDGNTFNGYNVIVSSNARIVTIRLKGKLENGNIQNHGEFKYMVNQFPSAQIQGTSISKTFGMRAVVSLGPDSPFTGISFNVLGGSLTVGNNEYSFTGNIIPASLIKNAKPGQNVAIEISYKRAGSDSVQLASGLLKVVP